MTRPQLTFFCELENEPLALLLTDARIAQLQEMQARLSLGLLDLSNERAEVVRKLNQAGIPVVAWLLLPREQGYWFHAGNHRAAAQRYKDFQEWTAEQNLTWDGVGMDIEPDIHDLTRITLHPWRSVPMLLGRLFGARARREAVRAYQALAAQIRADGYCLESYQFPLIDDERRAFSTILQRVAGVVDVRSDREVWMLYSSFVRPLGAGILTSYAPQAPGIALGVTGGGVTLEGIQTPQPLSWDELSRDLRLAWNYQDHLYIFSLEGCVEQGYLDRLLGFIWDQPMLIPDSARLQVDAWRSTLQTALWFAQRLPVILLSVVFGIGLFRILRRRWKNR